MSLVAAIDQPKSISTWSRALVSLAGILDHIRFTACSQSLTLLAVNSSRTTHGEVVFNCQFFREFSLKTASIMPEGFQVNESDHSRSTYSFIVSSKHIVVLFKNLDAANLSYICLQADCHHDVPIMRRYKLMVEILTKKLIVKKYQMNYQPVLHHAVDIPREYKQDYEEGNARYFMVETATLKLFFDMVPVSTEDFRIDVKTSKILFGAYTKQILKDHQCLKQPMLITILMAVDELTDSNLGDISVLVNFRLKDFRNFISLCGYLGGEGDEDLERGCFETFFKANGDPIVFEHTAPNIVTRFIQITAEDGDEPKEDDRKKHILAGHTIHRVSPRKPAPDFARTHFSPGKPKSFPEVARREQTPSRDYGYDNFDLRQSSPADIVTYGQRSTLVEPPAKRSHVEEDTDYGTSDDDKALGPTQVSNKPKSLFD